jgi:hypothetical protein
MFPSHAEHTSGRWLAANWMGLEPRVVQRSEPLLILDFVWLPDLWFLRLVLRPRGKSTRPFCFPSSSKLFLK